MVKQTWQRCCLLRFCSRKAKEFLDSAVQSFRQGAGLPDMHAAHQNALRQIFRQVSMKELRTSLAKLINDQNQ